MKIKLSIIILLFFVVACQAQTPTEEAASEHVAVVAEKEEVVEATAVSTDTPVPPTDTPVPPTETPVPTNTATPTATAVPPTDTPEPTDTPQPSPTATHTAVPTKAATAVPPTPTPQPRAEVHSFSSTEVVPFTEELFLYHMGRLRDTMVELNTIYIDIGHGAYGSCIGFGSPHKNWTTHLPIYTDLPDKYYPLYAEYRSIIRQAVSTTMEISTVCAGGGGEVSEQTDAQVVQFLSWVMSRTEAMVQETIQLQQQP